MNPFAPRRRADTHPGALRDAVIAALSVVIGGALGFAATTLAVETGLVSGLDIDSFGFQSAQSATTVQEQPADPAALWL
jgi:hypothetical protein